LDKHISFVTNQEGIAGGTRKLRSNPLRIFFLRGPRQEMSEPDIPQPSAISPHEKINGHKRSGSDHESANPDLRQFLRVVCASISTRNRTYRHHPACGHKINPEAIKATAATPLIIAPRITFNLFIAWISVIPSAASMARFRIPIPPPKYPPYSPPPIRKWWRPPWSSCWLRPTFSRICSRSSVCRMQKATSRPTSATAKP